MSKRHRVSDFLDVEAQEDNISSDFEDSEDEGSLADIINDVDPETLDDENVYPDVQFEDDDQEDEEQEIADAVARARKRACEGGRSEFEDSDGYVHAEKSLDISSKKLWELIVPGRNVFGLVELLNDEYKLLKSRDLLLKNNNKDDCIRLFSFEAFYVKGLAGRIFVLTDDFSRAAKKLSTYIVDKTVFMKSSCIPIPPSLFSACLFDFLRNRPSVRKVEKFQFVRFRRNGPGFKRGDVAVAIAVDSLTKQGNGCILLAVIPRLDQQAYLREEMWDDDKAKILLARFTPSRSSSKKRKREIPPAILDPVIYEHMPLDKKRGERGYRAYNSVLYKDGLQMHFLSYNDIKHLNLHPLINDNEIQPFSTVELTFQAVRNHLTARKSSNWQTGDLVIILRQEFMNHKGIINDIDAVNKTVTLRLISHPSRGEVVGQNTIVGWNDICRAFRVGAWVRVVWGRYKGRNGFIINESKTSSIVTLWAPFDEKASPDTETTNELGNNTTQAQDHGEKKTAGNRKDVGEENLQREVDKQRHPSFVKKPSPEEFLITVFQEFLEEPEAPSFQGRRHDYAPGTVDAGSTLFDRPLAQHEETCKAQLEAAYRHLPQPIGKNPFIPKAIPLRRRLFEFGRGLNSVGAPQFVEERLTGPLDPRIGKEVLVVAKENREYLEGTSIVKGKGHSLKGRRGFIRSISLSGLVTIDMAGSNHPVVELPMGYIVCLDDPTKTMDGTKLERPIQLAELPEIHLFRSPSPIRGLTPEPTAFMDFGEVSPPEVLPPVDLGECAFLTETTLGMEDWHFYIGFKPGFDNANWVNRRGYTIKKPLDTVSRSAGKAPEIVVFVKGNRSGEGIFRRLAPISELTRAAPLKQNDEVVILKQGESYGKNGKVTRCSRKEKNATVEISGVIEEYTWADLCTISISNLPITAM